MSSLPAAAPPRPRAGGERPSIRMILGVRACDTGIQGPENLILGLADSLRQQGVRYVVANLWDGEPPVVALHEELERRGHESHVLQTAWGMSPTVISKLWSLVRKLQPDVVHTHDVKAEFASVVAARLTGLPLVGSYYGRLALQSWFLQAADVARFPTFRLFDRVLANSEAQRAELLRYRVPGQRVGMLPSFVDAEQLQPPTREEAAAARERLGLDPSRLVLATIARLSLNKGHCYMLRALPAICRKHPNLLYLISGEGDMSWRGEGGLRGELEREAAQLGVSQNVRFLGYYPDVRTVLHACDLIVSPSLLEGMQVALLEAMAAGRPVVATNIGGTPDAIVDGENGLLVPPADPATLAVAVQALLDDPERRRRLGEASRRRLEEQFAAAIVARQLLGVCQAIV